MYVAADPLGSTMWQEFEGGIYWVSLAETCNDILMAAEFQGNTVPSIYINLLI